MLIQDIKIGQLLRCVKPCECDGLYEGLIYKVVGFDDELIEVGTASGPRAFFCDGFSSFDIRTDPSAVAEIIALKWSRGRPS